MKACFQYLNIIVVLFSALSQANGQPVKFSLTMGEGPAGSEVRFPINVSDANDLCGMQLDLRYDPEILEVQGVEKGQLMKGKSLWLENNPDEPGRLRIAYVGLDTISGDGELIQTIFTVRGSNGQTSPLTLENVEAIKLIDTNQVELRVLTQDGTFTVGGMPQWLWPAVIGGGALLLILLIAGVLRGGGKKRAASLQTTAPSRPARPTTTCGAIPLNSRR